MSLYDVWCTVSAHEQSTENGIQLIIRAKNKKETRLVSNDAIYQIKFVSCSCINIAYAIQWRTIYELEIRYMDANFISFFSRIFSTHCFSILPEFSGATNVSEQWRVYGEWGYV